jgi:hypothetical protein
MPNKIVKLPGPVAAIYKAVAELTRLYPDRTFTPDGYLADSIGEAVVAEALGLTLHKAGRPGHNAVDAEGRQVQIKITAGDRVDLGATCDRLVVLLVISQRQAEIIYDGPGALAWDAARWSTKNGQRYIGVSELRVLAAPAD